MILKKFETGSRIVVNTEDKSVMFIKEGGDTRSENFDISKFASISTR